MPVKTELRRRIKATLSALSGDEIRQRSAQASQLFVQQPEYQKSENIMIFLSLPTEIDTTPLALAAWQDRKRVLAPRVSWQQRRMIPVEIRSLSNEEFEETEWNIRQPASGLPFPIGMIDLVVVPGLGFDAAGNRLGRGRGFYDRFLADQDFRAIRCAMAFEEQFVESIPADPHDVRVDMLVSDQKVRRFQHK